MVALLAAICLSQAPDLAADKRLDALVTYTTTGEAISRSLGALSKSVGLTLSASHPFDYDIVAIRVAKAPLRDLMSRLSTTLKLSWRATDQGYTLYQTPDRAREAAKELDFERINMLRGLRAEHRAQYRLPRPDFDEAERRLNAESTDPGPDPNTEMEAYLERAKIVDQLQKAADPTRWFVSAVIASLTDDQLRTLHTDGALSFSNRPNRLQIAIPKQAEKDLSAWAARLAILEFDCHVTLRMVDGQQLIADAVINQEGKYLDSKGHFLRMQAESLPSNSIEPRGTQLDKNLQLDGLLGLGWRKPSKRQFSEKAMASVVKAMSNPAEHEFLRAVAGEALVELGEKTDNQLVAFLQDDIMEIGGPGDPPQNGRKMLAQFCDDVRSVYTEENGWLTVAPRELTLARAKRFPRKHFKNMASGSTGILSLEELARIVYECSDLQLDSDFVRDQFCTALSQTEEYALASWGEISALRLWHSLEGAEKQRLFDNAAIRIGDLDSESKRLLWRTCALGRTGFHSGKLVFSEVFRNPQGSNPARVYPNGFPADELLEAQVASQQVVLSKFTGGGPVPFFLSLDLERLETMSRQNPVDMNSIRLGVAALVRLSVDRVTWSATFRSEHYDFRSPPIPWTSAPEDLRKQFDMLRKRGDGSKP